MSGDDWEEISTALVGAVFAEPEASWVYDQCLIVAQREPWQLVGIAATCIGHLARLRSYLRSDTMAVLEELRAVRGATAYVDDAISDVRFGLQRGAVPDTES